MATDNCTYPLIWSDLTNKNISCSTIGLVAWSRRSRLYGHGQLYLLLGTEGGWPQRFYQDPERRERAGGPHERDLGAGSHHRSSDPRTVCRCDLDHSGQNFQYLPSERI